MCLGTGAIQGWWEPHPNTRHSREVSNPVSGKQPCKWPPTSTVTLKELQWRNLPDPIPTMNNFLWGVGRAGCRIIWQNRRPKQRSTKLNWASKLPIWWPKQWSVQGTDPQRSAQQTTAILAARAQMQAHCEASPCGHPTDPGDRWTHWLEINLAYR